MTNFEDTTDGSDNQEMVPFDFSGEQIRTVIKDNEPWFVAIDIAKILGYEKPNNAINTHCKKVNKFKYPETGQPINIIPESDLYRLIIRSKLPTAERFGDWVFEEVLPSIRKTGKYELQKNPNMNMAEVECNMIALRYTLENLKPSPLSVIQMTKALYLDLGLKTSLLPNYIENTRVSFSLTELLKKNNFPIGTQTFNKLLLAAGYLELKERPSKSKGTKQFKVLTDKGLRFGSNDTSVQNPREIQPHYYEDTFTGLYLELTE